MNDLESLKARAVIPAMTPGAVTKVRSLENVVLQMPQTALRTTHDFHAGLYARTVHLPPNCLITGVLIKIPTLLIVAGSALVYIGEDTPMHLTGYNVLKAEAGRKQAFFAQTDVALTMIFATKATTVEEAEAEFTDETHLLMSRRVP